MKKKILICDDSEGIRESLKLILEDDFELTFAKDGLEAVEFVEQKPFDLALLDIKMPRLNGLEALKQIRKIKPDLKVLFVTGYQSTDVAKEAIKLGANDYIIKPFSSQELKETVQKILTITK